MTEQEIMKVFGQVFNNMPNPIFSRPIHYGARGHFIYEVAITPSVYEMAQKSWTNARPSNPLRIFDMLFVDGGAWVTVLECETDGTYSRRIDLDGHIDNKEDYENFIEKILG